MRKAVDLSFAGCGFLGMFHIGSLAAFRACSKQGEFILSIRKSNINIFQLISSDTPEPVAGLWWPVLVRLVWTRPGSGLCSETWCLPVVSTGGDLGADTLMWRLSSR